MSVILNGNDSASVLYLSYDGMTDDIGQSQVLPYLIGCAAAGHSLTLVSFEKNDRVARFGKAVGERLSVAGIDWRPERFRSWPPVLAKIIDQLAMARAARGELKARNHDLIHARSYIAGRGALAMLRPQDRFLFDMRGFWADQRREGGRWSKSNPLGRFLYRRWKGLEAQMIARANYIVVLAESAQRTVEQMPAYRGQPISVIPCCADFDLFTLPTAHQRAQSRANLGLPESALVIAWLGSLGTVYRSDLLFRLFAKARDAFDEVRLLFIGKHSIDDLVTVAAAAGVTLSSADFVVRNCARKEVPLVLAAADIGSCFIVPGGSSAGVSPTKLGEMLACGLPVVVNAKVGDVEEQIARIGGGVTLKDESDAALEQAVAAIPFLMSIDRQQLRNRAQQLFDLPMAISAYNDIYRSMKDRSNLASK